MKKYDIINLGSTYAYYDFDYSELNIWGKNCANVPQYLDYDYVILKKVIKRMKRNGKILICLPDFVFAGKETNDNRRVYYKTLYPWEIAHFSIKRSFVFLWKEITEPFTHRYYDESIKWKGHIASYDEKVDHAEKRIFDWENKLGIPDVSKQIVLEDHKEIIKKNVSIVTDMIDLCRRHYIEPILITPPISTIMQKMVSDNCLHGYLFEPIEEIIKEKDVRYLNYLYDQRFSNPDMYLNSDCLNETGRMQFTETVMKDIGSIM